MPKTQLTCLRWTPPLILTLGCAPDPDQRLVDVALESTERQAEQNRQMANLQKHVAEGGRQLVAADAKARQELVELQRDLRTDQSEIGRQRDALEIERRQIAKERYWDSLLGTSLYAGMGLLACLLPLLLAGWMLHTARDQPADEALAELLVEELTTDHPLLLPHPAFPRLDHRGSTTTASLPGAPEPDGNDSFAPPDET